MVENNFSSEAAGQAALRHSHAEPRGVLHGNLKMVVYLGAALLLSLLPFSVQSARRISTGQEPTATAHDPGQHRQQRSRVEKPNTEHAAPACQARPRPRLCPRWPLFGCVPGQPCTPDMQQQNPQRTPEQQQEQQLAAKERELAFESRFTSNIAYARPVETQMLHLG